VYLTFSDYIDMGGTLTEAAYTRLEYKARRLIDAYTLNRVKALTETPESVKMLSFELICLGEQDEEGGQIASVGNDGLSISYTAVDSKEQAESLIRSYLAGEVDADGTPLLFRGVEASCPFFGLIR